MPRRPREEEAGAIHHVYARGVAKRPIFRDSDDHVLYLDLLERAVEQHDWRCLAYCLMGNHVHLLVETPHPNLGLGMQRLHGIYATEFNRRHGLSGHVFQGRYGAVRVRSDAQLATVAGYIVMNPVEAGLAPRPDAWPWSSHRAVVDGDGPSWLASERLLELFEAFGGDGLQRYVAFVEGP